MSKVDSITRLALYYRDLLSAVSQQSGKHLVDLGSTLRYGLTADLGLFVDDIKKLIESDKLILNIERMSPEVVSEIISKSDLEDVDDEAEELQDLETIDLERNIVSSRLVAIYRKQEQDRYNRETTIGFPIIAGKYGSKKFCAPLFYITVKVAYDPLESKITLIKDYVTPIFNSNLIAKLVNQDDETELVRQKVLPLLYEDDFSLATVEKTIKIIAELVEAFRGLTGNFNNHSQLKSALEWRGNSNAKVFNAISIINSARSNAFLQDELMQLAKLDKIDGETVIETILEDVPENIYESTDDPDHISHNRPLLFPLPSNQAQRRAARKAEKARLMVIQGPPGTGKSQTIANLVCDLVAQGKSVLIASHQNKALEVISEKLPDIDYLAMSLLKGEKASTEQLVNQLGSFNTFVADASLVNLNNAYSKTMESIVEKDNEIRRLKARFSELKTLERDNYPKYFKYSQIRNFNNISKEDLIPEGDEEAIGKAIIEWCGIFRNVYAYTDDLKNYFSIIENDKDYLDSHFSSLKLLTQVIENFENAIQIVSKNNSSALNEIMADETIDLQSIFIFVDNLNNWLKENGQKYLEEKSELLCLDVEDLHIESAKKLIATLGNDILYSLIEKAEQLNIESKNLLQKKMPSSEFSTIPNYNDLDVIQSAINTLEQAGWIGWHLKPGCKQAQKLLESYGINNLNYKSRENTSNRVKDWLEYWRMKYKVIEGLEILNNAGLPVKGVNKDSPVGDILRQTKIAVIFLTMLERVNRLPKVILPEQLLAFTNNLLKSLSDLDSLALARSTLDAIVNYLKINNEVEYAVNNLRVLKKLSSPLDTIMKSIHKMDFNDRVKELVLKLKKMLLVYPSFVKLLEIERTALKTIPNTLRELEVAIKSGIEPEWLNDINKAIEAYRLEQFISRDILQNPDNTDEIALKIRKIGEQKRDLVIRALNFSRKIALKNASNDNSIKIQVTKIKKILGRKRKTASLMQLKGQVDYTKLLCVFPCWIMSIDDVARIFPLTEGIFDYLIVDEASQCNQATTLHLAYRAKRMIVVGDQRQMRNANIRFLSDKVVRMLLTKHGLDMHPKLEFLHGRESLLALAEVSANCTEFLNEHFRCEPPIIAWSNNEFYDNKLRVLTPIRERRFKPCLEVKLVKGADDNRETKQNIIEAEAVAKEISNLIANGDADGLTIGVMSLYREQASLLQNLIYERLEQEPELLKRHQIIVSTADGFQGDERDIILYSMRYGPSSSPGTINAIQNEPERINVAFSRAKRKMICFISRPIEEFPKGIIRDFLRHADQEQKNPTDRLGLISEDRFDSEFEKNVCFALRDRGLTVYTQVPCSTFSIDMVVIDNEGRRIAVECDGDFHYEEDGDLRAEDYQRQDIIERSGWCVHRIPSRSYYNNPEASINKLIEILKLQPTDREVDYKNSRNNNDSNRLSLWNDDTNFKKDNINLNEIKLEELDICLESASLIGSNKESINSIVADKNENDKNKENPNKSQMLITSNKDKKTEQCNLNLNIGPIWEKEIWFAMSHWGKHSGKLSTYHNKFCYKVGLYLSRGYQLTEKQTNFANQVWNLALDQGFELTKDEV